MANMQTDVRAFDLLHDERAREAEREWVKKLQNRDWLDPHFNRHFEPGVSVIIPAHKAVDTIRDTIQSLAKQTMPASSFEVLVVCNGEDDGTEDVLDEVRNEFPELNLRIFHSDVANAGVARNLGLSLVRNEYVSFVDADDQLEARYLENAFIHAAEDRIIASPIVNCSADNPRDEENTLNQRITKAAGTMVPLEEVPWMLGFNACKMVAARYLTRIEYNSELRSGEDLVFFSNLLKISGLTVVFPDDQSNAAYLRNLREASVSRQKESFDFNVKQRVDCIAALREISVSEEQLGARTFLENAQLGFIKRYLESHPEELDQLENYVGEIGFISFPWNGLTAGKAKDLAISYCFSPFSDTSAVVAEKAIAERRRIVDVISNNMSKVRHTDESLSFLSSRWVDKRVLIDTPPSFAGWEPISDFAEEALRAAEAQAEQKGGYDTLYSRALWVGSHVAGALFKNRHPETSWTAEFSDPLRFGVEGEPRQGALVDNEVAKTLRRIISNRGFQDLEIKSLFDLVEAATMVLADEVIFTNQNQMTYMLSAYPADFRALVENKAIVRPHPVPSSAAYAVVPTDYLVNPERVNIGYFGSFYVNRGLGDVFTSIMNMKLEDRRRIALHIFCNTVEDARKQVLQWGLQDVIKVNPYLPYMEFLNASTKFDVLLVNDVAKGIEQDLNPFLPSKISDYRGSGAKIWGLIDDGSPLSKQPLDFESPVSNSAAILNTLQEVVQFFDSDLSTPQEIEVGGAPSPHLK